MLFEIKERDYLETFIPNPKKGFQHTRGKNVKLFPFATDIEKLEDARPHLRNFKSITAALHRNWLNKEISIPSKEEEIIDELISKVETNDIPQLKDIIRSIVFDRDKSLVIFDKMVIPFINKVEKNAKVTNLIEFLFHLFDNESLSSLIKKEYANAPKLNTLHNLVLDYLSTKSVTTDPLEKDLTYYNGPVTEKYREMFRKDFFDLIKNPDLFKSNINNLIKYYYFVYILELSLYLNSFLNPNIHIKLFFSLDWEKLSQSRLAVNNGYKKLEYIVSDIFSHANCIELLNTIDFSAVYPNKKIVSYEDIRELYNKYDSQDLVNLEACLNNLFNRYINSVTDITWETEDAAKSIQMHSNLSEPQGIKLLRKLFNALKYQFENSGRKSANKFYNQWYREFVQLNFYKNRGRLGGTLKLDKDNLLMFTELAISSQNTNKILITTLWEELEKRNINLDNQSKLEAISYFQKINILEKKSDSGDAQYITSMYR